MEKVDRRGVVMELGDSPIDQPDYDSLIDRGSSRLNGLLKAKYFVAGIAIGVKVGLDTACVTNNPFEAALMGWNAFRPFL